MAAEYHAFGLRIVSDLDLPELTVATATIDGPAITIRVGNVAPVIPSPVYVEPANQISEDDFLHDLPGIARYRVRCGSEIVVDPHPQAPMADVRLYLLGTALGMLCHQRGMVPLHANAIDVAGTGVAFAGPAGAGKSTLAAGLNHRGHRVLSDDLCVLSFDGERILVWPGLPQFRLCPDALEAFGHDRAKLKPATGNREKYILPNIGHMIEPCVFKRLYVLNKVNENSLTRFEFLHGVKALSAIVANIYRPRLFRLMRGAATGYHISIEILKRVEVFSMERPWGFDRLDDVMDAVEHHFPDEAGHQR